MYPNTEGILESSLYVIDVAHSVLFYKKIFGFQVISDFGERGCAMKAGSRQVLLLSRRAVRATRYHFTTAMVSFTLRSRSPPTN